MKIIVNSEREKQVIEMFTEFIEDWIESSQMYELLKHTEYGFESHELDLIQTGFHGLITEVDKKEHPIYLQSDNLTGKCKYCDGWWQGIEDENEVTIEEYERLLNLEKEEGYHAECLREYQCARCGSDEETNEFEGIGRLCARCDGDRVTYKLSEKEAEELQKLHPIFKEESK